jgi:hypothetical protein
MTNALAGKMDKSANGADIADISAFLNNLVWGWLRSASWYSCTLASCSPAGWLKCNGALYAAQYPLRRRIRR